MKLKLKLICAVVAAAGSLLPGSPQWTDSRSDLTENLSKGIDARNELFVVLYGGPLVHDENWVIKAGPVSPDNQKFRAFGGTCSMIPEDVHNVTGSGYERVTFSAVRLDLGFWKMSWSDTVTGTASDGNRYVYRQQFVYQSVTSDGRPPRPNRATPVSENDGFLQGIATNVKPDSWDLFDAFALLSSKGDVVASSRVHWTWRLPIPPANQDPPPDFFPVLLNGYVLHTHDQLAGQLGCDPL